MSLEYISCPAESQTVLLFLMWGVCFYNSSHGKILQSYTLYKIPFVNRCAKDVSKLAFQTHGELKNLENAGISPFRLQTQPESGKNNWICPFKKQFMLAD